MLTTECSKPCAKKMKIGIQAQAILPMVEFVVIASTTARQTIQLHSIALTKHGDHAGKADGGIADGLGFGGCTMRSATPAGAVVPILVSAMAISAP